MADSQTERAKQKAAEMRDAVKEKSDQAEKKVKESVKAVEKHPVGKHIPTSLDSMTFRDIIKITLLINSVLTLGLYCIITEAIQEASTGVRGTLLTIIDYGIIIFGIGGIIVDTIFFFLHLFSLFKFFLLWKFLKIVTMMLFVVVTHKPSWFMIVITTIYTLTGIFLDFCFVYYLAIYEERVMSDDYDENGMLKQGIKEDV